MPDSGKDYIKAPFSFWEAQPYGNQGPPEYFTRPLNRKLRLDDVSDKLKDQILKKHPFHWGMDYWSTQLPNSNLMTITITHLSQHHTHHQEIPGLNETDEKNRNIFYSWQQGMSKIIGYYFANQENHKLTSLEEITTKRTNKTVNFYFYGGEGAKNESPQVIKLTHPEQKKQYYAVCIENPNSLTDILALIHEIAHIELMEKSPLRHAQIVKRAKINGWLENWQTRFDNLTAGSGSLPESETAAKIDSLYRKFISSKTFQKQQGTEMIKELETWIVTLGIIDELGMRSAFERNSDELLDYIYFAIKTRIVKNID